MANALAKLYGIGNTIKRNLRAIGSDPSGMLDLMARQTAEDIGGTKYEREQDAARLRKQPYDAAAAAELDRKRKENMLSLALTFAGPMAKTADLGLLSKAQEMVQGGANPFDVWQKTGWTDQFPDRKWRFEISDDWASMRVPRTEGKAGNYMTHVDLQEAYPAVNDVKLARDYGMGRNEGSFFDNEIRIGGATESGHKQKSTMLHELQHWLQKQEGFARGGSPEAFGNATNADDLYRRIAGEAEARLVQKRMNYTPEMRRSVAPWQQFDVPADQQIVRMGDNALLRGFVR